jgi:hypothetical protein
MAAVALVALIGSAFAVPALQIANSQYPSGSGSSNDIEQQLKLAKERISNSKDSQRYANPAGLNSTSTSNMTGAAGNTTGSNTTAHGSSIHTTNPAAFSTHDSGHSIRNVK